ncbi:MAG: hypothetical protein IPP66_00090 [Anaerolineales bacterium]|nr:hypothetical protein [Anaerolineales bacterium]
MPTITRWFIKAALVSLVLGLAAGIWQQVASTAGMFPVYLHLLTFGWLTQLIFGVAIWMFPMYSKEHPRGPEWLVWSVFGTLNLGLLLRVVFEPLQSLSPTIFGAWALVAAAILQWYSGMGFAAAVWKRIRTK